MSLDPAFLEFAQRQGDLLAAKIVSRDNVHLSPATLSKAAAARLKSGLRALEAFLRRILVLMALAFEPGLEPQNRLYTSRPKSPFVEPKHHFKIFTSDHDCPDLRNLSDPWADPQPGNRGPVVAAPLLARLSALKALLEAPEIRARRLAFHLARRRPGWLLAPGREAHIGRRWGTELSALYDAMATAILEASKARPPPWGPVPKPEPRLTSI